MNNERREPDVVRVAIAKNAARELRSYFNALPPWKRELAKVEIEKVRRLVEAVEAI